MAWETIEWACGHKGEMQLYGKNSARDARAAYEAGRKCIVCWLLEQWHTKDDPRYLRKDRVSLAADIALSKGVRFLDRSQFLSSKNPLENPLAEFSTDELLAEIKRRKNAA